MIQNLFLRSAGLLSFASGALARFVPALAVFWAVALLVAVAKKMLTSKATLLIGPSAVATSTALWTTVVGSPHVVTGCVLPFLDFFFSFIYYLKAPFVFLASLPGTKTIMKVFAWNVTWVIDFIGSLPAAVTAIATLSWLSETWVLVLGVVLTWPLSATGLIWISTTALLAYKYPPASFGKYVRDTILHCIADAFAATGETGLRNLLDRKKVPRPLPAHLFNAWRTSGTGFEVLISTFASRLQFVHYLAKNVRDRAVTAQEPPTRFMRVVGAIKEHQITAEEQMILLSVYPAALRLFSGPLISFGPDVDEFLAIVPLSRWESAYNSLLLSFTSCEAETSSSVYIYPWYDPFGFFSQARSVEDTKIKEFLQAKGFTDEQVLQLFDAHAKNKNKRGKSEKVRALAGKNDGHHQNQQKTSYAKAGIRAVQGHDHHSGQHQVDQTRAFRKQTLGGQLRNKFNTFVNKVYNWGGHGTNNVRTYFPSPDGEVEMDIDVHIKRLDDQLAPAKKYDEGEHKDEDFFDEDAIVHSQEPADLERMQRELFGAAGLLGGGTTWADLEVHCHCLNSILYGLAKEKICRMLTVTLSDNDDRMANCTVVRLDASADVYLTFPGDLLVKRISGKIAYAKDRDTAIAELPKTITIKLGTLSTTVNVSNLKFLFATTACGGQLPFICALPLRAFPGVKSWLAEFPKKVPLAVPHTKMNQYHHLKADKNGNGSIMTVTTFAAFNNGFLCGKYSSEMGDCGSVLYDPGFNRIHGWHVLSNPSSGLNLSIPFPQSNRPMDNFLSLYDIAEEREGTYRSALKHKWEKGLREAYAMFVESTAANFLAKLKILPETYKASHPTQVNGVTAEGDVFLVPSKVLSAASAKVAIRGKPIKKEMAIDPPLAKFDFGRLTPMVRENIQQAVKLAMEKAMTDGSPGRQDPYGIGYAQYRTKREALEDATVYQGVFEKSTSMVQDLLHGKRIETVLNVYGKREWINMKKMSRTATQDVFQCRTIQALELPVHIACVAMYITQEGLTFDEHVAVHHSYPKGPFLLGTPIDGAEGMDFYRNVFRDFSENGVELDVEQWDQSLTARHITHFFVVAGEAFGYESKISMACRDTMCGSPYMLAGKPHTVDGLWWPSGIPPTLLGNGIINYGIVGKKDTQTPGEFKYNCILQGDDVLARGMDPDEATKLYSSHGLKLKRANPTKGVDFTIVGKTFSPDFRVTQSRNNLERLQITGYVKEFDMQSEMILC